MNHLSKIIIQCMQRRSHAMTPAQIARAISGASIATVTYELTRLSERGYARKSNSHDGHWWLRQKGRQMSFGRGYGRSMPVHHSSHRSSKRSSGYKSSSSYSSGYSSSAASSAAVTSSLMTSAAITAAAISFM